jgi:hypothetical protein
MAALLLAVVVPAPVDAAILPAGCVDDGPTISCTFDFTGSTQTWTVPDGVTSATVDLYGASGGDAPNGASGGNGAHVRAAVPVTAGDVHVIEVGGEGSAFNELKPDGPGPSAYNGGGPGYNTTDSIGDETELVSQPRGARGGGGATDFRTASGALDDRLVVAGGGGGAAYSGTWISDPDCCIVLPFTVHGGAGGSSGTAGSNGNVAVTAPGGDGGGAGSATGPGSAGAGHDSIDSYGSYPATPASDGSLGQGGTGGNGFIGSPGGGGGGGYFGGGGGGGGSLNPVSFLIVSIAGGGGGGGGSSFLTSSAVSSSVVEGDHDGNGKAVITWAWPSDDTTQPTVEIEEGSLQADPTTASPIVFDVEFSEAVTGVGNDDIELSGTAGATTAAVTANSGTRYTVEVSGMTSSGTVIAKVKAGAAVDDAENTSVESTSEDNTVQYNKPDTSIPSVTIAKKSGQTDPATTTPIEFTALFSESVTGFADADVDLTGTAGATSAVITGSGTTYNVAVSGMTSSGTVIAKVKAGAATDGTNSSTASGAASVTYDKPPSVFDPGPATSISGDLRVGSTLTAGEGSPSPTPDSYIYRWFANGVQIGGATGKTFILTSAQTGKTITVEVTALKSGYTSKSNTSAPTGVVKDLVARHLELETTSSTYAGTSISVELEKLSKFEPYTIRIDNVVVKTGTADSDGEVDTTMTVPLNLPSGNHAITGTGAFADRFDSDALKLKSPSDLDVELKSSVKKGGTQKVEVDDLLRGEQVQVRYDGNLVSPPSASGNSSGEYRVTFPVGTSTGTHTVKVTGTYDGRSVTKRFKVTYS